MKITSLQKGLFLGKLGLFRNGTGLGVTRSGRLKLLSRSDTWPHAGNFSPRSSASSVK